jgi:sugar phosphate isomerase/epimerase
VTRPGAARTAATAKLAGIGDEAAAGLRDQVRIHVELGLPGLEFRTDGGRWIHDCDLADLEPLLESGLTVTVVDTPVGGWSTTIATPLADELRILTLSAERALALGCNRLRVMSYPDDGRGDPGWETEALRRMRVLVGEAAALGVTLLHENCHGWGSRGAASTLRMLEEAAGLRLLFDTGNGVWYGYDGPSYLRQLLPYVDHVHIKDAARRGTEVVACHPGEGEAGLAESLRLLRDACYRGWYSIEPHLVLIPHLGIGGSPEALETSYRNYVARIRLLLGDARD